ncbi:MAG: acyl-CoA dehydrogenase C-terminal domain-containing protein, partial [Deltaproteobacteria bacterium]|nr:acyl-CoA dehydrogenase C-terminal domain-containing protein [Deltaproteobacteria bacterium]
ESAFLNATPFLEMCGHVEVARLLIGGAHIATGRLEDILKKCEVSTEDRPEFIKSHAEARFYDAKVKTAKFFVNSVIPHVRATANGIQSGDRSALDIVF